MEEVLLESDGDGGLAGGRETSEPDGGTLLLAEVGALSASETRVPCDVAVAFVRICESVGLSLQRPMAGSWRGTTREHFVQQIERTHVAIAACGVDVAEEYECEYVVDARE